MKNSYQEHFENFLINASLSQKALIYLASLLLIAMFFFKTVVVSLNEKQESLKTDIENLKSQMQLEDPKTLLRRKRVLQKRLLSKRSESEKIKEDTLLLESKLAELPFRIDEKKTALILNKLLKKSLDLNIELNLLTSSLLKKEQKDYIKLRKKMKISGKGKFINLVYFLHYLEGINVLSDIKDIEIDKDNGGEVKFKFDWLIYGVDL